MDRGAWVVQAREIRRRFVERVEEAKGGEVRFMEGKEPQGRKTVGGGKGKGEELKEEDDEYIFRHSIPLPASTTFDSRKSLPSKDLLRKPQLQPRQNTTRQPTLSPMEALPSPKQIPSSLSAKYGPELVLFFESFQKLKQSDLMGLVAKNQEQMRKPRLAYKKDKCQNIQEYNLDLLKLIDTIKVKVSVQDLVDLDKGTYFDIGVFEVFLKLMKLFHNIALDQHHLQLKQEADEAPFKEQLHTGTQQIPKKIMYMELNEIMEPELV